MNNNRMPKRAKEQLLVLGLFLFELLLIMMFILAMYMFDTGTEYTHIWIAVSVFCGGLVLINGFILFGGAFSVDDYSDGWEDILFRKCFKNYEDLTRKKYWNDWSKR